MLTYHEAVQRILSLGESWGVPSEARLFLVEKRRIELLPAGEIEGMDGDASVYSPMDMGDGAEGEQAPPLTETLVWIGEFTHQSRTWELAVDERGELVRLRKSR